MKMAEKLQWRRDRTLSLLFSTLLFFSLLTLTQATPPSPLEATTPNPPTPLSPNGSSPPLNPVTACKTSLYPKLCRSLLSPLKSSSLKDYGRFSIKRCMKETQKTAKVIDRFLTRRSSLRHVEAGALEDCRLLSDLNADYLTQIAGDLWSSDSISDTRVGRVNSLLSAIVTNQHTCYEGLEASSSRLQQLLGASLANGTKLYSISLDLVANAWKQKGRFPGQKPAIFPARDSFPIHKPAGFPAEKGFAAEKLRFPAKGLGMRDFVTVSKGKDGNFTSINEAVASAPNNTNVEEGYFVIYVKEGVYEEHVTVARNKKNLMVIGDGINRTVVTGNRSVVDGWTTFNSATFAVMGERFIAMDITICNTAGPEKHQAVALRNSADLSAFYRCSFQGYQDTLYTHSLRQFYRNCDVYGTVDFIFGNSAAVLQNCNLYARQPMPNQKIAFTAQGRTDPNQVSGLSIHNCTIKPSPELDKNSSFNEVYLGRPWKEYSRTVYMQSYIDGFVDPAGWLEWNGSFALDTLYYGEFMNRGPGSNTSRRVQWPGFDVMDAREAWNFTVLNFTMGDTWLPSSVVPFAGGLL
ncbi:probable pectinesterase/pectinesterase inhibitor 47 [Amborella trichopoda]|nr:probable pectinesterase/pectinesterase inhibitor 47 [Amborella trichopoda]|eukprot:XP_006828577.2 probable pectinesterase/pectinesterase inhibitor 47 [Amborella trichopoda]